ncbi:hypothetical protein VTN77DRAFT_8050 [Rasamsonia byssochlamydoides]|uniref:uncharacterized protein n=1 Tax=Rasamsonia byssochlamydoides TaxID=89139 RepID=UPI0037425451
MMDLSWLHDSTSLRPFCEKSLNSSRADFRFEWHARTTASSTASVALTDHKFIETPSFNSLNNIPPDIVSSVLCGRAPLAFRWMILGSLAGLD